MLNLNSLTPEPLMGAYGPDVFADSLLDFMSRHAGSDNTKPFFAYFPMALTHDPFQPSPDHPDYAAFDPDSMRVNDPAYFADNLTYMDKTVGRLVEGIDELGIRENTIILFIGDNGTDRKVTSLFEGSEVKGEKGYTTRYGTHVPMIVNWAGEVERGQINNNLIDLTDFLPTLMNLAGAELPNNEVFDGLSFHDQLYNAADSVRSWVFCHYVPQWGRFEDARFVHNHEWKLYEDGRIYNFLNDPRETDPLAREDLSAEALEVITSFDVVLEQLQ